MEVIQVCSQSLNHGDSLTNLTNSRMALAMSEYIIFRRSLLSENLSSFFYHWVILVKFSCYFVNGCYPSWLFYDAKGGLEKL